MEQGSQRQTDIQHQSKTKWLDISKTEYLLQCHLQYAGFPNNIPLVSQMSSLWIDLKDAACFMTLSLPQAHRLEPFPLSPLSFIEAVYHSKRKLCW